MTYIDPDTDFDRHASERPRRVSRPAPIPIPGSRPEITEEPEPSGCTHDPAHQDIDWIGHANQGGGHVPDDFEWRSNPRHDRLVDPHSGN